MTSSVETTLLSCRDGKSRQCPRNHPEEGDAMTCSLDCLECGGYKKWTWTGDPRKRGVFYIGILLTALLLISLLVSIIVLAKKHDKQSVCLTKECVVSASHILQSMDSAVDPCTDFYNFSCGNYKNRRFPYIPLVNKFLDLQNDNYQEMQDVMDEEGNNDTPVFVNITKSLFKSCVKPARSISYDSLMALIKEMHGWPLLFQDDSWNSTETDWTAVVTSSLSTVGVPSLFDLSVGMNQINTSWNMPYLSHPGIQDAINISTTLRGLISKLNLTITNSTLLEMDISELETLSAEVQKYYSKLDIEQAEYMSVKELDKINPEVNWTSVLRKVVPDITEDDTIGIFNKDYLIYIFNNLTQNTITLRTIQNYVAWRTFITFALLFPPNTALRSDKNIVDLSSSFNSVAEKCISTLEKTAFKMVLNYMFLRGRTFSDDKVEKMVQYLQHAFRSLAEKADWLDEATKNAVFEKLDAMTHVTKPLANVTDTAFLEYHFLRMGKLDAKDPIGCVIASKRYLCTISWNQLRERNTLDQLLLAMDSLDVNAFYVQFKNAIVFPTSIQQVPFYSASRPWYLNFASIGMIIGHEITHGFDNKGSTRDKSGNLKNWWSESSKKEFELKTKCFVNQYNRYDITGTDLKQNGSLTLGENIADNGGLRQAYLAYKNWVADYGQEPKLPGLEEYSVDQLFFLTFGTVWCSLATTQALIALTSTDDHSLDRNRVIGTLSNFDEFSTAFNCKKDSPMNPPEKCVIW